MMTIGSGLFYLQSTPILLQYMAWILNRISALKRFVLARQTKCDPGNLRGQVQLVDRLIDACLYCIGLYVTIDSVQEDMGAAAKGFVALGSVGTLVVSLASQGLAAQLFNGLFLASSNRVAVGDFVKFSNGVSGTVIKLGWMETIIRGPDEVRTQNVVFGGSKAQQYANLLLLV